MKTAIVEFWSDWIDAPKTVERNLSDDSIIKRMTQALKDAPIREGDLWAVRRIAGEDDKRFCAIKQGGIVRMEPDHITNAQ